MNKLSVNFMKKYFKTAASALVVFAILISAFTTSVSTVVANTDLEIDSNLSFDTELDFGGTTNLFENNSSSFTNSEKTVVETHTAVVTECSIKASKDTVKAGEGLTLEWKTKGFTNITINGEAVTGNDGSLVINNVQADATYTLIATNSDGAKCKSEVKITCLKDVPKYCELTVTKAVDKHNALPGDNLTYTITVKNTGTANCTGGGVKIEDVVDSKITYLSSTHTNNLSAGYGFYPVYSNNDRTIRFNGHELTPGESGTITWTGKVTKDIVCGDFEVTNQAKATARELNNFNNWSYSTVVKTQVDNVDCNNDPAPTCDVFTATPATILAGASTTLAWETSNSNQVFLNNGIGAVSADGSISVAPLADIVYKLTVIGAKDKTVNCEVPVKVSEDSVPVCEMFTATPNKLPVGGGNVTLNWKVLGATSVSITPTVGSVALIDSKVVNVTGSTNFVLTATDADGDKVTCPAPVVVSDPVPLSCANNVTFTASNSSIRRGNDVTLNWSTTNVDSVSISGINSTSLAGTRTVSPDADITYVLTAKIGNQSVDCPVSVDVSTGGGGGGGSNTPRCDLEISDTKISLGDSITLKWNTSNATEVTLTDDKGKVIFSTEDKMGSEKRDLLDGSITLKPTRNTEYTLLAERSSRDKSCKVEVELDKLVVLENRDQQPLVAGISLSQVPYTGFEAGTFMTIMFYALLIAWASYIAYLVVVKKNETVTTTNVSTEAVINPTGLVNMQVAEKTRPDLFVATTNVAPVNLTPVNLPTSPAVVGYENHVTDVVVTKLENQAHAQKALLSSDAVRHLVSTTGEAEREEALNLVIAEAKKNYPLEDGWIVINESRMKNLCEVCQANVASTVNPSFAPALVPEGSGSLAEAIVTGNVVAAYEMIGNRPMFSLADAAADLDALYRARRGGEVKVSEMLMTETANLSDEKIKNMISALTSALDGTYTDEASAVKMAIMKALKEVA